MSGPASARFLRFCVVGGIGFCVDAGALTLLVNGFGWNPYLARLVSFSAAVTVTWLLNRRWVFARTANATSEYAGYFAVQCVGAAINLGTYVAVIQLRPELAALPVIPLAIGAGLALVFNFLATKIFVYGHRGSVPGRRNVVAQSAYSGRENLEAMRHARNYNRFLIDLIERHAPAGTTLDFGAGAGTFAIPMSQAGHRVVCVEPDDELRRVLVEAGLEAFADIADIEPGSADYIYTLNVLEHIEDDRSMVELLSTRLKPGGVLLIYVPAFEVLYSAMDELVGHFRRYRRGALRDLVRRAGLVVERAAYVDSLGFVASLVYRAFGSSGTISAASVRAYDRLAFPLSRMGDFFCSALFGKNVVIVARKPA